MVLLAIIEHSGEILTSFLARSIYTKLLFEAYYTLVAFPLISSFQNTKNHVNRSGTRGVMYDGSLFGLLVGGTLGDTEVMMYQLVDMINTERARMVVP